MPNLEILTAVSLLAGLFCASVAVVFSWSRSAADVLQDMEEGRSSSPGKQRMKIAANSRNRENTCSGDDTLFQLIYGPPGRYLNRTKYLLPIVLAQIAVVQRFIVSPDKPGAILSSAVFALAAGYLFHRILIARLRAACIRRMEFYLPVVMERVVMAVQAGHDVIAALRTVLDLAMAGVDGERVHLDPVCKVLQIVCRLVESGSGFEESLAYAASLTDCSAVKHAFIHLGLAYRQGGELVMPLSELSDSTQLYYQETIEEQIARMPVKATAPLVLTFAGLIVCFITAPMVQVINVISEAMPK